MIVGFLDLVLQLNLQPSSIGDGEVDSVVGGRAYFTETFKDYNNTDRNFVDKCSQQVMHFDHEATYQGEHFS